MKTPKIIRVILKDQAKEAYEMLCKVIEEQKSEGRTNSDEIQLLKSINKKVEILKYNQAYGQGSENLLKSSFLDLRFGFPNPGLSQ